MNFLYSFVGCEIYDWLLTAYSKHLILRFSESFDCLDVDGIATNRGQMMALQLACI